MSRVTPPYQLFVDVNATACSGNLTPAPPAPYTSSPAPHVLQEDWSRSYQDRLQQSQQSPAPSSTYQTAFEALPPSAATSSAFRFASSSLSPTSPLGNTDVCPVEVFEQQLRSTAGVVIEEAHLTMFGKAFKVRHAGRVLCVKVSDRQKAKRGAVPLPEREDQRARQKQKEGRCPVPEQVAAENVEMERLLLLSLKSETSAQLCPVTAGVATMPSSSDVPHRTLFESSTNSVISILTNIIDPHPSNQVICVTTPWLEGGSLLTLANTAVVQKDSSLVLLLTLCMLLSVYHLHVRSIAHLDVSLENFVVDIKLSNYITQGTYRNHVHEILRDGLVKLIDFGMATRHFRHSGNHNGQIAPFAAPHQQNGAINWGPSRSPSPSLVTSRPGSRACSRAGAESPISHISNVFSTSTNLWSPTATSATSASSPYVHSRSASAAYAPHFMNVASAFGIPPPLSSPPRFLCRSIKGDCTVPGKPGYVSSELILRGQGGWDAYRADLQSVGKCLYLLVMRDMPDQNQKAFKDVRDNCDRSFLELMCAPYAQEMRASAGWSEVWDLIRTLLRPQEHIPDVDQVILSSPTMRGFMGI